MAKHFMRIDRDHSSKLKHSKAFVSTNRELCALCQKDTMKCSTVSYKKGGREITVGSGSKSLATNLIAFQKLLCLPVDIDLKETCLINTCKI